jgi:hypothetical protein
MFQSKALLPSSESNTKLRKKLVTLLCVGFLLGLPSEEMRPHQDQGVMCLMDFEETRCEFVTSSGKPATNLQVLQKKGNILTS